MKRLAALMTFACLLAACGSLQGQAQGTRRDRPEYAAGGERKAPPRTVQEQALDPVKIEGVQPDAEPKLRYSAAICLEQRCNFSVRVSGDCHISLDPEWMAIATKLNAVTLVFTLRDSPGYSLKGMPVHDKARGEFFRTQRVRGDDVVEVNIANHFEKVKQYALEVRKGNDVCGRLDPPIIPDL